MASKDLHNSINSELIFFEESVINGATVTSSGFDTLRFESIEVLIDWNILGDTVVNADTTIIKLQDSDDNSVFSDVDSTFILGAPLATGIPVDTVVYRIGYVGKKRFIRLVITGPTGTNNYNIYSFLLKGVPLNAPTSVQP